MNSKDILNHYKVWFGHFQEHAFLIELTVSILVIFVLSYSTHFMAKQLKLRFQSKNRLWKTAFLTALHLPLVLLVVWLGLFFMVDLLYYNGHKIIEVALISSTRDLGVIFLLVLFLWRFATQAEAVLTQLAKRKATRLDKTTIFTLAKLARLLIILLAVLMGMQTLGIGVSAIIAFGGIGTAAIAFSSKDLLANFFGGLIIFLDKPFSVGDWIRSPDRNIEGTVEDIGWRLTVIRTFDKRPLYVPNSIFNTISVENPQRMTNRRIRAEIGLRYEDAGKIKVILEDVEDMLRNHPDIDTNMTLFAKLTTFADSSLTFLLYTFTKTTAWVEFQGIQQDVFLKIIDIVLKHGAEFAFPSQTLYVPDEVAIRARNENAEQG